MSNPDVSKVAAGKPMIGGGVYVLPASVALPTDANAAMPTGAIGLGYISDAGLRPTNDSSVDQIKAWGGDVVAAIQSEHTRAFEFTLLEIFNKDVNEFVFGKENVVGSDGKLTIKETGDQLDVTAMVFDMKYARKRMRIVVPIGQPTITGEEPYVDDNLSAYNVRVDCMKDKDGVKVYRYYEDQPAA